MPKVKISFSIVASSARELNGCDSSAEVEMRRPEGEGDDDQDSTGPRRYHWLFGICIRSNRGAQVGGKPLKQVKPPAPMGCKLVGTVKGTKLWAGDCAAGPELRGTTRTPEPEAPGPPPEANPPAEKQ